MELIKQWYESGQTRDTELKQARLGKEKIKYTFYHWKEDPERECILDSDEEFIDIGFVFSPEDDKAYSVVKTSKDRLVRMRRFSLIDMDTEYGNEYQEVVGKHEGRFNAFDMLRVMSSWSEEFIGFEDIYDDGEFDKCKIISLDLPCKIHYSEFKKKK